MAVIKDVAKLAEVSTGTVSKYLNNPSRLKEKTRLRVEKAINELSYTPSPLARSMRTKKTNSIAIVMPDVLNPFYGEVYSFMRTSVLQNGYTPILYTTADDLELLKSYLSGISIRQLDGLILCFVDEDEIIKEFIEEIQSQVPIVLISWDVTNVTLNTVVIDVFEGIYTATNHLISLGHKNIAYIGGFESSRISREKYNGFVKAMDDAGLKINLEFVYKGPDSLQTGYHAARKLSRNTNNSPTAIVAEDDFMAVGSMKYFLQNGIKIPDEIAIIGFDDILVGRMYEPSLSTISLPKEQIGVEAVKLLLSKIQKTKGKNKQINLKTTLEVRSSTVKNAPVEFEL
jgi:DNA-binding LacI/PurR family transcriptional regulator